MLSSGSTLVSEARALWCLFLFHIANHQECEIKRGTKVCAGVCVCECMCVCVCVCEREREREGGVCVKERECVCV